jgi:hypothetical protein
MNDYLRFWISDLRANWEYLEISELQFAICDRIENILRFASRSSNRQIAIDPLDRTNY